MYQKEIIYMGLYKDGIRIGSAGFVKVENREHDSRLYLKTQNIPHSINGRFPIRVYNGSGWKELSSVMIQDGGGIWEDELGGRADHAMLQVMLPGGYLLEGKSKSAAESQQTIALRREPAMPEGVETYRKSDVQQDTVIRSERPLPKETEEHRESDVQQDMAIQSDLSMLKETEEHRESNAQQEGVIRNSLSMPKEAEEHRKSDVQQDTATHSVLSMPKETEEHRESSAQQDGENHRATLMAKQVTAQMPSPSAAIVKEELPRRGSQELFSIPEYNVAYPLKEDKWEQILDTYEQIHPYGDERLYVKLEPKDFVILQAKYQHLVNNSFLLHGFYNYRYVILGKEEDFYLGVPGVFYEREKMVALMFGFEAFECPGGNVRAGTFGYYLRKVEL